MQTEGELLSPKEAMRLTGLSRSFLYHLDETGVIKALRIGTGKHLHRRFRRSDLLDYMEGRITIPASSVH